MEAFRKYIDWRTSWSQLVLGRFSRSGFDDLLLYDRTAGVASFFESDGQGGIRELATHTDWRRSWTHVVPLNFSGAEFTDLLLYDQGAGHADVLTLDGQGGFVIVKEYVDWRQSWALIVPGHFTGAPYSNENDSRIDRPRPMSDLLLYDRLAGYGFFVRVLPDATFEPIREHADWRSSWSHIVADFFTHEGESGFSDLLFYERGTGEAEFYSTDGGANIAFVSRIRWPPTCDQIRTGRFGGGVLPDLLVYDASAGAGSFFLGANGAPAPIEEYRDWRRSWSAIVPGRLSDAGFSDLLFYDATAGEAEFYHFTPPEPYPVRPVEAYPSAESVMPGNTLDFHVSLQRAGRFTIDISRIGAADRLMLTDTAAADSHPVPPDAYARGCGWPPAYTLRVSPNWPSGLYRATIKQGAAALDVFFVVKALRRQRAPILLSLATTTHQAYGWWGGRNLYGHGIKGEWRFGLPRAAHVSFHRPQLTGSQNEIPTFELPFVRWLEAAGYRVDCCTSVDLHADPDVFSAHRLFLSVGHDEYWSREMRDNVEAFIAEGGNAAFFSGNTCWWQIRFEDENRTIVCFKNAEIDPVAAVDPTRATVHWWESPVNRPANSLTGVGSLWIWQAAHGAGAYRVNASGHWVFAGTGLRNGDDFGRAVVVEGAEFDHTHIQWAGSAWEATGGGGTPREFVVLAVARPDAGDQTWATMGIYQRPGEGTVFTAAAMTWARALEASDPAAERITRNVLDRLSARPRPRPPDLVLGSPSS